MREDNDFTQQKVADEIGWDRSLYSKYELEQRDIPLHIIVKLATLYNTSVDYLVYLTDDPKPYKRRKS